MSGTKKEATPLTEEQLLKKETDLKTQSEKLEQDQKAFDQAKTDFLNSQENHGKAVEAADLDLNNRSATLDQRESALNEKEAEIDAKIVDLVERESALEDSKTEVKKEKAVPGLAFELEKEKFKFRDTAPKTILFDGKARTQNDLVKDQEALLQLSSNQSLIEKIN